MVFSLKDKLKKKIIIYKGTLTISMDLTDLLRTEIFF